MKTIWKFSLLWALFLILPLNLHAQIKAYPNELKGYEFYGRDRLAGISLAKSTKQDIEKIFGESCSSSCNFDENWRIRFLYFGDFTFNVWDRKSKAYKDIIPKPQYEGKLYSIIFLPKNTIPFEKYDFPSEFVSHPGGSRSSSSQRWEYSYYGFRDKYGLYYRLLGMIEVRDSTYALVNPVFSRNKGDLIEIAYEIPEKKQKSIWIKK